VLDFAGAGVLRSADWAFLHCTFGAITIPLTGIAPFGDVYDPNSVFMSVCHRNRYIRYQLPESEGKMRSRNSRSTFAGDSDENNRR
jgi:hypothetical protein